MYFEDVFEIVGAIGIYQVFLMFYIFALGLVSIDAIRMNFVGGYMRHWCHIPALQNFSHQEQLQIGIPYAGEGNGSFSKCYRFPLDYNKYTLDELLNWDRESMTSNFTQKDWIKCDSGWVFDQSDFVSTIASQWNLVCDDEWKVQMSGTSYMAGWLAGGVITGPLSDRFGRKIMVLVCHTVRCVGAYLCLYCPVYEGFVIGQVIMGITSPSANLTMYVIVAEITDRKWRATFGVSWHIIVFSCGGMVIPGVAYFVRDHFYLMAVFFWPLILFFVLAFLLDESPRWLLSQGREKEAIAILNRVAKINKGQGVDLPEDLHFKEEQAKREASIQSKGSFADLFRTPNMRKKTAILWLSWFTMSLVYYGLSLNARRLPGSVYLNSFLLSFVELPAYITGIVLLGKIGRKWTTGGATLLAGVATILCIPFLMDKGLETAATALSIVGKGAAATGFCGIYVFTAELNPTNIRNIALGSASMTARISGMAAPFVGGSMADVWKGLPSIIYGLMGLGCGTLIIFLLPETLGHVLPETIEEAEDFGKRSRDDVVEEIPINSDEEMWSRDQQTGSRTTKHTHEKLLSTENSSEYIAHETYVDSEAEKLKNNGARI